jgi:hypothetical protein
MSPWESSCPLRGVTYDWRDPWVGSEEAVEPLTIGEHANMAADWRAASVFFRMDVPVLPR